MASFLEALAARYGAPDDTKYDADAFLVAASKPRGRAKKWEMVGLESTRVKQAQHTNLSVVSLPDAGIEVAERDAGEIAAANLTRLTDLDLSRNRLSVDMIETVVHALPRLCELQLNGLRFPSFIVTRPWLTVTTLTLNGTKLLWQDIKVLEAVPNLQALHFESNDLSQIEPVEMCLPKVTTLNIGNNRLTSWRLDAALQSQFPLLTDLRVHGNSLPLPDCEAAILTNLTTLWISDNPQLVGLKLLQWLDSHCPRLGALRVSYCTLLPSNSEAQARMLTIACLPTLSSLNNGIVRPKERTDAELYYLQRALSLNDLEEREQCYHRWSFLKEKYASMVMPQESSQGPAGVILLNLTFRALGKSFVNKTLPTSLTVGKMKSVIAAFWPDLPADKQRLVFYSASEIGAAPPEPLDDDLKPLSYFGVGDHAVIEAIVE